MWRFFLCTRTLAEEVATFIRCFKTGKRKAPGKALLIFKELGEKIISPYR